MGKSLRPDIIEKDYHLHRILVRMAEHDLLSKNLAFKGGTCLLKAYTGYYRFSEDIDFTWTDTSIWKNKSKGAVKRSCSVEIDNLISRFNMIANDLGLKFTDDKNNIDHVHISSGGRMVRFFIDYLSEIQNIYSRIKIEINFIDETIFPFVTNKLNSYVERIESEELRFLYTKLYNEYSQRIDFTCYDPREIYIEKCRAALTRHVYKLRDILDIFHLEKNRSYSINQFHFQILEKTRFMLELYRRYNENLELMEFPHIDLTTSDEMKLMIVPPPHQLVENIQRIHKELTLIKNELLKYTKI